MLSQTVLGLLNVSSIGNLSSVTANASNECNAFHGVCSPGGEVFLGPDFSYGSYTGFSMWHDHGGDHGEYGAISQMPVLGEVKNPFEGIQDSVTGVNKAGNDYYKFVSGSNITVELGASNHSGIYQYTFPGGYAANVVIDISHVFQPPQGQGLKYKAGSFEVLSDRIYKGTGHYIDEYESVHNISFCGYFDNTANATLYELDGKILKKSKLEKDEEVRHTLTKHRVAVIFTFPNTTIISRVGISKTSEEEACKNVNAELPKGMHINSNGVFDADLPEISVAPSPTANGTKPDNTTLSISSSPSSADFDVEDTNMDQHHFKIFVILLGVILGLLFLSLIILFALCLGAHRHFKTDKKQNKIDHHFRSAGMRERDGAADMPPRL